MTKTNITPEDIQRAYESWQALIAPQVELGQQLDAMTEDWRRRKEECGYAGYFAKISDEDADLKAEYEEYKARKQALSVEWSDALNAEGVAKMAHEQMRVVYIRQCANLVRQALYEHLDELDGKPAHYKRTMKAIQAICDEALEGTRCKASVYNKSISVYDEDNFYGHKEDCGYATESDGTLDAELTGRWYGNGNILNSPTQQLTAEDVTRMCNEMAGVKRKLNELRDAYIESCTALIVPYRAINYSLVEELRKEAVVADYKL